MESVLHDIEELQRMAEDLATATGPLDMDRYETDCDLYTDRIEAYLDIYVPISPDFVASKMAVIRSGMRQLLRETGRSEDLGRYQAQVHSGLNGLYRSIRRPVSGENADVGGED